MYCKECGNKLPDGVIFCEQCGTKVTLKVSMRGEEKSVAAVNVQQPKTFPDNKSGWRCTKCGYNMPDGTAFCTNCGTKLNGGEIVPEAISASPFSTYETTAPDVTSTSEVHNPMAAQPPVTPSAAAAHKPKIPLKYILMPAGILAAVAVLIVVLVTVLNPRESVPVGNYTQSGYSQQNGGNSGYGNTVNVNDNKDNVGGNYTPSANSEPKEEYYISDKTGISIAMPPEGYAQISFDGSNSTVPAGFESHTPTEYSNYDTYLYICLDGGTGKTSKQKIDFCKTTKVGGWEEGKVFNLDDLKSKMNHVGVCGIYRYYMSYLGSYSEYIFTHLNDSYFDDVMLKIIGLDGDTLKFYFYVKIHDSSSSHTIEGIANVVRDAGVSGSVGGNTDSNNGGNVDGGTLVVPTTPSIGGSEKCAVCHGSGICSVCDGSGQTWGWKKKVTCTNCHGTTRCPFCQNGYVSY